MRKEGYQMRRKIGKEGYQQRRKIGKEGYQKRKMGTTKKMAAGHRTCSE